MERLLIILAVLVCAAACVAAVAMSARGRRPPLRMDGEIDEGDEALIIGSVGAPASPIDRSAQVLDAQVPDADLLDARAPGPTPTGAGRRIEGPRPAGRPDGAR